MPASQKSAEVPSEVIVLEKEATVDAANSLAQLAQSSSGAAAKAARTALFRLKSKGIVPEVASKPSHLGSRAPETHVQAMVTGVSGEHNQIIMFHLGAPADVEQVLVSFYLKPYFGIQDVVVMRDKTPELEKVLSDFRNLEGSMVADVRPIDAMTLVLRARGRTMDSNRILPVGFHDALKLVNLQAPTPNRALIYDLLDSKSIIEDLSVIRDPATLLETVGMTTWWVPIEIVSEWEEKYFERVQSPLAPDENSRMALGEPVVDEATNFICREKYLSLIKYNLEEQAWVYHSMGKADEAKMAFYHAVLLDPQMPGSESRFVREMVRRSILVCMALKAEEEFPDASESEVPEDIKPQLITR